MMALVQQWQESGKEERQFASEQGITPWKIYYSPRGGGADRFAPRRRPRSSKRRGDLLAVRVISGTH
jgi:hypothetical protein